MALNANGDVVEGVNNGANRTEHLHICHLDTDRLENGTASIVTVKSKVTDTEKEAYIDTRGFFRCIDCDDYVDRDLCEIKW